MTKRIAVLAAEHPLRWTLVLLTGAWFEIPRGAEALALEMVRRERRREELDVEAMRPTDRRWGRGPRKKRWARRGR